MKTRFSIACAVLATIGPVLSAGETLQLKLKWSEVGPAAQGSKVEMVLPTGTHIKGKVLGTDADGMRVKVSNTSNKKDIAKGERVIPRHSVSVLRVVRYGKAFRILCTTGFMAAAAIAITSQQIDLYEGPAVIAVPAAATVGTIGVGVAGYYVGKRIDRRITDIVVIQD